MQQAVYYHAGCPVCVNAEETLLGVIDSSKAEVEVVHLGEQKDRISEAENLGIKSVPAIVLGGNVLHLNYGASLEDVKNG